MSYLFYNFDNRYFLISNRVRKKHGELFIRPILYTRTHVRTHYKVGKIHLYVSFDMLKLNIILVNLLVNTRKHVNLRDC